MSVMSLIAKVRTKTYVQIKLDETAQLLNKPYSKNTGAWKGRLKRFFVDPYAIELAKKGSNII